MNWFFSSGDAPFFFSEQLQNISLFPNVWRGQDELGVSSLPLLWIDYPFRLLTSLLFRLGLSWFWIEKIWWVSILILGLYGVYTLASSLKIQGIYRYLSSIIYMSNTYVLLLFDGGQLGVALAYALFPLALNQSIHFFRNRQTIYTAIKTGLIVGIFIFFDIRLAYIFSLLHVIAIPFFYVQNNIKITRVTLLIPLIIIGVNFFWLYPSLLYKQSLISDVSAISTGSSDISFFSFADFSHSLSLLHPNYPENLFGKVYFMQPEFLLLPIFAFLFLLFSDISYTSIAFGCIAVVGIFLGKGTRQPFGEIYQWFFVHIPGFFLFRDPTKWYVLTSIAYSILIPLSFSKVNDFFRLRKNKIIIIVFLLFWLFSLRALFQGKITGNVMPKTMTNDYQLFKETILQDTSFGRTIWLPSVERLAFTNELHPAVSASSILSESSPSGIVRLLKDQKTIQLIASAGGEYIVVPEDINKRMFLSDYKPDSMQRIDLINTLDTIPSIQKNTRYTSLAVYKMSKWDELFSLDNNSVPYSKSDNDLWRISLPERISEQTLYSLIHYDPGWKLLWNKQSISPKMYNSGLMSFNIPPGHAQIVQLEYEPTHAAYTGTLITLLTLLLSVGTCFYTKDQI